MFDVLWHQNLIYHGNQTRSISNSIFIKWFSLVCKKCGYCGLINCMHSVQYISGIWQTFSFPCKNWERLCLFTALTEIIFQWNYHPHRSNPSYLLVAGFILRTVVFGHKQRFTWPWRGSKQELDIVVRNCSYLMTACIKNHIHYQMMCRDVLSLH